MSQLRKHLKFSWKNKWRAFQERNRIGFLGVQVFIDKNVEFYTYKYGLYGLEFNNEFGYQIESNFKL
jgi:hypothetical protein